MVVEQEARNKQLIRQAVDWIQEAIKLTEDNGTLHDAYWGFARASLYLNDLHEARRYAEKFVAKEYAEILNDPNVLVFIGVIDTREGELIKAEKHFNEAIDKTIKLIEKDYDMLYSQGLSLCGLALCTHSSHERSQFLQQAKSVYNEAMNQNQGKGVIRREFNLFEALREKDQNGYLIEIHNELKAKL